MIIGKDKKSYYLRSVDSVPSDGNFESKIFDNGKLYAYGVFSHNTIDDTFEKSPTKYVNRGNLFSKRRRGGTKKKNNFINYKDLNTI